MNQLVNNDGKIDFGIYSEPVSNVNYTDYDLKTPMGTKIPWFMKHLKFNQFVFTGILGPEFMAGIAIVDLKNIANGFFYVYDRKTGFLNETNKIYPSWPCAGIKADPNDISARFSSWNLKIRFKENKIKVKADGMSLDAELNFNDAYPLRICTRAGYKGWVYTQKTSPLNVKGEITVKDKKYEFNSPDYMALVDWTGGYMRKNTYWNWASTACTLEDNRSFGLNLASGVNETGCTENAFWINNKMVKVDTVNFKFNDNNLMREWYITSCDDKINLKFTPEATREEKTNAFIIASKFTQISGVFNGTVTTDEGEIIRIRNCPGWTEDHYAKW